MSSGGCIWTHVPERMPDMSAPPPPDVVEPLHPSGIAEAATVLAAALADDPGFVHLFPVRARRERELRAMYRMTLSDSVQHGHAFVTRLDGVVTGAIALYPPGAYPMTPARWWRQAFRIAADRRQHPRAQPRHHQVRRRDLRRRAVATPGTSRRSASDPTCSAPAAGSAHGDRVRAHRPRRRARPTWRPPSPTTSAYYTALGYDPAKRASRSATRTTDRGSSRCAATPGQRSPSCTRV